MTDIDRIISEIDSSMAMEGLTLTSEDRDRIRQYLADPTVLDQLIEEIVKKYAVSENAHIDAERSGQVTSVAESIMDKYTETFRELAK